MLANHNERIQIQYVSSFFDVQEKIRVWVSRAVSRGYTEDPGSDNLAVLKRKSMQGYQGAILAPIMGLVYGTVMYGFFGGIVWAAVGAICGVCGIPLAKPTVVSARWNNDPPFHVDVNADGNKGDFKNVIRDLKYILSTDPGTSLQ